MSELLVIVKGAKENKRRKKDVKDHIRFLHEKMVDYGMSCEM